MAVLVSVLSCSRCKMCGQWLRAVAGDCRSLPCAMDGGGLLRASDGIFLAGKGSGLGPALLHLRLLLGLRAQCSSTFTSLMCILHALQVCAVISRLRN